MPSCWEELGLNRTWAQRGKDVQIVFKHVFASGGKTAGVVVQICLIVVCFSGVSGGGVGGWGGGC